MRGVADTKRIVIAAIAVLVAAGFAFAGYGLYQKRALRAQVVQTVDAASDRLAAALGADLAAPTPALVEQLDRASEETEAALQGLRAARTGSDPRLAEAADDYVGNVLAVLKRQDGSARGRLRFADSRKALADHLAKAGQRDEGWSDTAIRLKERLDADYFEYRLAVGSLGNMLGELPAARAKIGALLPQARLPDVAAIKDARARALSAAEATRLEFERAKQLVPR